jgi:integrase
MKPVTLNDLARRYGQFLDFARRHIGEDRYQEIAQACAGAVTPELVEAYIAELQGRVGSVTVHGSIAKLRRVAGLLNPELGLTWLSEVEQDLEWQMRPAPKFNRIADTGRIVEAGLRHMDRADTGVTGTAIQRATRYRNGLMIALLALCPIRLKNFAALAIGRSLVQVGSGWWIVLGAGDTKERRPDERPVPGFLIPYLDRYILHHRPSFGHDGTALWVGRYGNAMTYNAVGHVITRTGLDLLGIPINPHLYRTSAASTAYVRAGGTPHLASALLNHRDPATTEAHYNRARSVSYSRKFSDLVEGLRK